MTDEPDPLEQVRLICLALPEVNERLSHGHPGFFVRDKHQIAGYHDDMYDGSPGPNIWCPAPDGVQEELVGLEPHRFFRPPYVGPSGWIGVRLDVEVDWDEVAGIVTDSYRMRAPKTLVKLLDQP